VDEAGGHLDGLPCDADEEGSPGREHLYRGRAAACRASSSLWASSS